MCLEQIRRDKHVRYGVLFKGLERRRGGALRSSARYTREFGVWIRCSNKCFCEVLGSTLTHNRTQTGKRVHFTDCISKSKWC